MTMIWWDPDAQCQIYLVQKYFDICHITRNHSLCFTDLGKNQLSNLILLHASFRSTVRSYACYSSLHRHLNYHCVNRDFINLNSYQSKPSFCAKLLESTTAKQHRSSVWLRAPDGGELYMMRSRKSTAIFAPQTAVSRQECSRVGWMSLDERVLRHFKLSYWSPMLCNAQVRNDKFSVKFIFQS